MNKAFVSFANAAAIKKSGIDLKDKVQFVYTKSGHLVLTWAYIHKKSDVAAPTTGEMWELLPRKLVQNGREYILTAEVENLDNKRVVVAYRNADHNDLCWSLSNTLADALCSLLFTALVKGFITREQI